MATPNGSSGIETDETTPMTPAATGDAPAADSTPNSDPSREHTSEYRQKFAEFLNKTDKNSALTPYDVALDIRKFEIELYWKRATYFWTFTGAALAAHLAVMTGKEIANKPEALLTTSCIGFVFSAAWYFVNRASKYWQLNWEFHVDLLEDNTVGPLYKTVLEMPSDFLNPIAPYPFSVSKINQWLSLFVTTAFLGLMANTASDHYTLSMSAIDWFPTLTLSVSIGFVFVMACYGRISSTKSEVHAKDRKTHLISWEKAE